MYQTVRNGMGRRQGKGTMHFCAEVNHTENNTIYNNTISAIVYNYFSDILCSAEVLSIALG